MRAVIFLFVVFALSAVASAQTPLQQVRNRAQNPLPTAREKTLEDFTYADLMELDAIRRRRTLHLISPDKQYELVAAHLTRMLEVHGPQLSTEQRNFVETTLDELNPSDFVRRQAMDQSSLMRAWIGDRLGRLYRQTDVDTFREIFRGSLADEIFRLE